jgi:hypothetical protein
MQQKEPLCFNGIIRSQGREVPCVIRVMKTTMQGAPSAFSEHSIEASDKTDALPDGSYTVHLQSGEEIPVTKRNGFFTF